jgi:hypothetical protein
LALTAKLEDVLLGVDAATALIAQNLTQILRYGIYWLRRVNAVIEADCNLRRLVYGHLMEINGAHLDNCANIFVDPFVAIALRFPVRSSLNRAWVLSQCFD